MEQQRWLPWLVLTILFSVGAEVIQEFEISEGVPVGTSIGMIGRQIAGSPHPPPPPPYLIVPVPGSSVDSDLTIDQSNGEILTRIQLDRETRDSYSLVAIPMTGENIRVIIRVKDENDHAPEFPSSFMHVEFPENTPRDVKRTLQPARDKDLGIYNTQRYTISHGNVNNAFRLSSHRERDGVLYLDLQVNGFLDRETHPGYSLLIEAFDGGVPPLKGSMTINITITDQNDNAPIWQFPRLSTENHGGETEDITLNQSRYSATVPENATVGTSVLQVFATDIDDGPNGQVSYSINRRQTDKDSVFKIDRSTGMIYVNGPLDFETKEVYELVVVARDRGIQPLETTVFVSIRVLDLNDNQMEINVSFFSGESDDSPPKVSEKALPGEFVARISVIDPDTKQEYTNVSISLEGGDGYFSLETVNSVVYLVVASKKLDREKKPSFILTVIARDKSNPYLNASTKFALQVEDDNDSPPTFEIAEYHANVLEVAEPGTVVVQVKATDEDAGDNARLHYELVHSPETHSDWFEINEESGILVTKHHINCEVDPTPRLTVLAKDHGKPQLTGSSTVIVHLIDTNDTPIFNQGFYNASVLETAPYGTCLLKVSATDPDCGINAELSYNLLTTTSTELPFSVNSKSGEICVSGPLDYEKKDVYKILVTASDTGGLSSTAVVNIQLIDENDNLPIFYPLSISVSIKEGNIPPGPIVVVAATDKDSSKRGQITYSFVEGNEDGLFSLDKNTGKISLLRAPSKSRPTHRLRVTARDGDNQLADHNAEVTVHIVTSEFQTPLFHKSRYEFTIPEDLGVQSSVGTVTASGNGRVQYSIVSGDPNSLFTIDQYTGNIKVATKLDHEEQPRFLLNIQAKLSQHEVISYCQVDIRISDTNDNRPEFEVRDVKIWIPETAEVGSIVYGAMAVDRDSGQNGEVAYSIVENPFGMFKIDKVKGLLTLQKALDYESTKEFTIIVKARDNGSPQKASENLVVHVEVQDSNDNAPVWFKKRHDFWIKEKSAAGHFVGRLTKRDKNQNGAIKFLLQPPNDAFRIDTDSGIINTVVPLYRNVSVHELTVVAYNQLPTQVKAEFQVFVHVRGSNSREKGDSGSDDARSQAMQYYVNVTENMELLSEITQVVALDEDAGNNARISYKIEDSPIQNVFGVYLSTGTVYLKSTLDRETQDEYIVKIIALDHGIPALSSTATMHITVLDENDNSPKFEKEVFQFYLKENNEPGEVIGQVTARDRDAGENSAIRYFFQPTHPDFVIDGITGTIKATSCLDREKQSLYELQAVAIDQGNPPQQSDVIVQVILTDENDSDPQIVEPDQDFLKIREQLPVGTSVARIIATDADEGKNSQISYQLTSEGDAFSIDAETGTLKTKKNFARSNKAFYTLTIKARDHGSPSRDSTREYRVEILDVNDLDSLFVPSKIHFKVHENASVGHTVAKIMGNYDVSDDNRHMYYQILNGNLHDAFEIHATTGNLVVAKQLNYEETPQYSILIKASLQTSTTLRTSTISVEIQVLDMNDERPTFPSDPTHFTVSESTLIGTPVWNFTAVDKDTGYNGIVHYRISHQEPNEKFRINVLTGTLYLQSELDYETCNSYVLIVTGTDQSSNVEERLNSSVTVNIFVQDENDNIPVFTSPSAIEIYELEPLKTTFHTVIAKDLDSSKYGLVSYKILSGNDEGIFNLNEDNGRLSLSKSLKRDVKRYSLNISAFDHGDSSNVAYQLISITVKADQNHAPRFSSLKYDAKIIENCPMGTQVVKVMAFKGDLDRNNTIKYIIPEGLGDGKFKINPTTGAISVSGSIDREEQSDYSIVVYAQDQNQLYVYDTATAIIHVTDDNDNAPRFHDSCTDLTVPENNELGVIHVFTAEDPDIGKNGEVTFVIAGGNVENMFNVDLHTGKLTGRPLDRERRSQYNLIIVAQDQGTPSRKTTCNVTISVEDENDSPIIFAPPSKSEEQSLLRSVSFPAFQESQSGQATYSASIPENIPIGTTVLKVQANDADVGVNSIIKYSLNNESHWHFTIDNTTGSILTAGALDREKLSTYIFEVAATDGGLYDSRSSTASVHFTITDFNDNRPQFKENPIVVQIPTFTKPGQNVVQVVATDADEGINAEITYSLESPEQEFSVNSQTGQITPVTSLQAERGRIFHLRVVAKDHGTPSMTTTALVVIQVGEKDPQNSLKFQEALYETDLFENSGVNTEVLKVTAVRIDGRRARINYAIVGGNEDNVFDIVPTSGVVRVRDPKNLDKERQTKFNLVISAKADGSPPQYAHTVAQITLLDVNDNFPRFTQESYIASVWEGNTKGTFVTQVTATDNDEGANANIVYHIIDGNRDNAFVIEPPFSGIVKTNIVLDREILDEYRLTIIATDEGSPQMTGTCYLHVNVIDIQDQSPVFPPHSVIAMKEDAPVGTLITTMVANDVDTNPTLVYGFTDQGNPDGMFSIGKYSGRVTLVKSLDFEVVKTHTAKIEVSDSVHTAYTTLTLNVMDSNDHRPQFSMDVYRVMVSEGAKVGVKVGQVNATDKDSGFNSVVKYSLRTPRGLRTSSPQFLRIDENTGSIYLNSSVVYQQENPFSQLIVVATDNGKPSKSSEATVWVEVRPSQSHILKFSQNKYRATVKQDGKPGTIITQLFVERTDKLNKGLHYHFSIVSGNDGEHFSINSHNGQVFLAKAMDKNSATSYTLVVSADCVNMEQCSSFTEITIEVPPLTGSGPVFDKRNYKLAISESKPVGSTLLKLHASNLKSNGNVVYDITSGNDGNIVELNPNTGVLVLNRPLDYDSEDTYRLVVRAAEEQGNVGNLWNFTQIELTVEDDNDNEPKFLFSNYVGMVGENEPVGTTVCTVKATDLDRGIYGKLQYSILDGDGKGKFAIASSTGVVTTNSVFDYESKSRYYVTVRANDIGGKFSTAKLQIEIESKDEYAPEFIQKNYKFQVPRNAEPGHIIGRVEAVDQDRGQDGRLTYHLVEPNVNFLVNRSTGAVVLRTVPDGNINATLSVMASSGRVGSKSSVTIVEAMLGEALKELEVAASSTTDWFLGALATTLLLLFIICAVLFLLHMRNKRQSKKGKGEGFNSPNFDTLDYAPTTLRIGSSKPDSLYGSHYGNIMDLRGNDRRRINNTISELSDQSNSASSGRGSAEDGEEVEEDEEICMINERTMVQQQLRGVGMLESGLQDDEDNGSQGSAKNTQEYLARLGIRPRMNDGSQHSVQNEWALSHKEGMDGMHLYEDKDMDGKGVDISALIYAQISDDLNHSMTEDKSSVTYKNVTQPSMTTVSGSLSSIVHNEEELAGSYNWDYLLDWGPKYQPLAHVFSEIAHLKEGSRLEPTYSGILSQNISSSSSDKGSSHHNFAGSVGSSRGANMPRTGPLPPLPILPRSPIPNDMSFASGPISPSFSPALSPLANRSPSISPLGSVATNSIRPSQIHDNYRPESDL